MDIFDNSNNVPSGVDEHGLPTDPEARIEALKSSGRPVGIDVERLFMQDDAKINRDLHLAGLGTDCACLRGEDCGTPGVPEYNRLKILMALLRGIQHEFPEHDHSVTVDNIVAQLASGMGGDITTALEVLLYAINRSNEFERELRRLQSGD